MMAGESSRVDVLERGTLPFVGRAVESGRIMGFWRETVGASGLRTMFIVGEAGVGKSRLLAHVLPGVVAEGGVVVHLRLYPESVSALVPLLVDALRTSESSRAVLRQEPSASFGSVVAALRRLARLRPTLLVLEDVHLLPEVEGNGESPTRELATLLAALSDEALSLLCVARPVETSVSPIIELYLVERLDLMGISETDVADLWRTVFSAEPASEVRGILRETTLGNPFALLMALRGVVRCGAVRADSFDGHWRVQVDPDAFASLLRRNVEIVSDGMAGHLSREERQAARSLAALGGVFSPEAAAVMIDDSDRLVERLIEGGIIARSGAAVPPLPGARESFPPFAFSHTLIHRHFAQEVSVDPDRLIRLFSLHAPVYSTLPFELLKNSVATALSPQNEVQRAVYSILHHAHLADKTPGRRIASLMVAAAAALVEVRGEEWEEMALLRYRLYVLNARLMLAYAEGDVATLRRRCDELWDLTATLPTSSLNEFRVWGLSYRQRIALLQPHDISDHTGLTWNEANELTERFPELRFTPAYVQFLYDTAQYGHRVGDESILRDVEGRIEELLHDPDAGESARHHLRLCKSQFLLLFDSPEELERRLRDLDELKEMSADRNFRMTLQQREIELLVAAGQCDRVVEMLDAAERTFREWGRVETYLRSVAACLSGMIGVGYPVETVVERLRGVHRLLDSMGGEPNRRILSGVLLSSLLLGGREYHESAVLWDLVGETDEMPADALLLLRIVRGEDPTGVRADRPDSGVISRLRQALDDGTELLDDIRYGVEELLERPIIRIEHLATLYVVTTLIELLEKRDGIASASLRGILVRSIDNALHWTEVHGLAQFTITLVERFGSYLGDDIGAALRGGAGRTLRERRQRFSVSVPLLRVSMLGTITIAREGEEPQRIGPRLRAFLGLLVADVMLERPLEYEEFCRLASGEDEDRQRARKGMNKAVFRLREVLGQDAVLTDGDLPRLNLDIMQVDLLAAHRLLLDARDAIRGHSISRAAASLRDAMRLVAAEVPFPSLYDSLFESLRDDFESRMHETILRVAEAALHEGDIDVAAELLYSGLVAMPEDESIEELLRTVLERQGRRAEAELLTRRSRG